MTPWREASLAVVDLETTGLDPEVHEVLSVAVIPVDHGRIHLDSVLYRTVRPEVPPDRRTIVIHGIRPVDAQQGSSSADVAAEVLEHVQGRILVAHVARIELSFLRTWLPDYRPATVIDTDALARLLIARGGGPVMKAHIALGAAAGLFGLPEHRRHHALGDALTTAQLFLATASILSPGGDDASIEMLSRADRLLARKVRRRFTWRLRGRGASGERRA